MTDALWYQGSYKQMALDVSIFSPNISGLDFLYVGCILMLPFIIFLYFCIMSTSICTRYIFFILFLSRSVYYIHTQPRMNDTNIASIPPIHLGAVIYCDSIRLCISSSFIRLAFSVFADNRSSSVLFTQDTIEIP